MSLQERDLIHTVTPWKMTKNETFPVMTLIEPTLNNARECPFMHYLVHRDDVVVQCCSLISKTSLDLDSCVTINSKHLLLSLLSIRSSQPHQVRSVPPDQVSPTRSAQLRQVSTVPPGPVSPTRSGQSTRSAHPHQISSSPPDQVSPTRSVRRACL